MPSVIRYLKKRISLSTRVINTSSANLTNGAAQAKLQIKRHVSFAEGDTTYYSNNKSMEEISNVWYQNNELEEFKDGMRATIRHYRESNGDPFALDDNEYCMRGLEEYLSKYRDTCSTIREVVFFYKKQKRTGKMSADKLRGFASRRSSDDCIVATKRGLRDEENALYIHKEQTPLICGGDVDEKEEVFYPTECLELSEQFVDCIAAQ